MLQSFAASGMEDKQLGYAHWSGAYVLVVDTLRASSSRSSSSSDQILQ
jgi:hypothetical protein